MRLPELRIQVENLIRRTDWWDNSEVQGNFERALDSYTGRNEKADRPGFESMRSEDTADMVEAITAEIMPAFGFDEIAVFESHGRLDRYQAALESKVVNQMIFDFNDGELEIQSAIKNLLLLRNGILKVYPEETVTIERERYSELNEIELAEATRRRPNQTIEIHSVEDAGIDEDGSQLTDISLTRTTTIRRLTVESIDPVNFLIESEFSSVNPQATAIAGDRRIETRSDLLERYPDKRKQIEELPVSQVDTRQGSLARNRNKNVIPRETQGDRSLDSIEVFDLYVKMDYDGDGKAERRHVVYAGGQILENELYPFVPYACGVAFLYPHRFQGISIYDKLREIERQKSRGFTQVVRNMQNNNYPELIVKDGSVADTDIDERRSSGVIRADDTNDVQPIPVPDIVGNSLAFLQKLDAIRDERAGSSITRHTTQGSLPDSAYSADREAGPLEALSVLVCNTVGSTLVRQLFRLVHQNLRRFWSGEQDFAIGQDQFVTTNPTSWPNRHKIRVTVGMSQSERDRLRAVLGEHLIQQEKLWEAGMDNELVSKATYYDTLIAWSKAGGVMSPRKHWINPESPEAKQAEAMKRQAREQAQAQQRQDQQLLWRMQLLISDRDRQADLAKHFSELRKDYWKELLGSEIEELRTEAQGAPSADPDPEQIDADQQAGRDMIEETPT